MTCQTPLQHVKVLRASGNFGVEEVRVVAPRCDVNEEIVSTVACASPSALCVHPTLQDALADSTISLAFSRRKGKGRPVLPSLAAFLDQQNRALGGPSGIQMALVFGREESGLEAEEIMMCSHTVEIPSQPSFPSLNLSHAVAVTLSQLYEAEHRYQNDRIGDNVVSPLAGRDALATHAEMAALYERIVALLDRQGIDTAESRGGGDLGSHGRRVKAPGHLKSMLFKSCASQAEVRSMFGLLKELEASIDRLHHPIR